jgi:DNA-binding SARP family transcriptional activator
VVFLKLFGAVSLTSDGNPVAPAASQRRRLALLAILAAAPEGGVSREKLVWYLWPDMDPKQARHFLADSVYAIRKGLGQDAILAVGDNLQLNPSVVHSDVAEFRQALAGGDMERAVRLYEAAFLDGFFVTDAAEFERWADAERNQLAESNATALEQLARAAESKGDHAAAVTWWRRRQVLDPLNSRVAFHLMTALDASGDRAAALRHGHIHQTLVGNELGMPPDPAITEFSEKLRTPGAPSAPLMKPQAQMPEENRPLADGNTRPVTTSGADRVASAALDEGAAIVSGPPESTRPRRGRQVAWWIAGVAILVLAGIWALVRPAPPEKPQRLFVLAFENRTGNVTLDPLGFMAADWIARGLMQTGVEVFSPSWSVYATSADPNARAASAARASGGTVISGAYYLGGGLLRLEARITDSGTGELLQALDPVEVAIDSATDGVDLLRKRVTSAIAARYGAAQPRLEITGRSRPPTFDAYREYVEGLRRFSRREPEAAARHFDRAWSLDTTFHLALLHSVLVAQTVGNYARADSLLESSAFRPADMALFDRLLLDVFKAEQAGDREAVLSSMKAVAAMTPASQYVVGHAVAAIAANRAREAREILLKVDPHTGLLKESPGYWEWLTSARHLLGEHRQELREAREARALHPEFRRGLLQEVRAAAALGGGPALDSLLTQSLALPSASPETPGDIMRLAAVELQAHGHKSAAAATFEKAIAWYQSRPPNERQRYRANLARTLYESGRFQEARPLIEELARAEPTNIELLGRLGTLAAWQGDRAQAIRIARTLETTDRTHLRGADLAWRARIAARLGDADTAGGLLHDALRSGVTYGLWLHTDPDLATIKVRP